MRVILWPILLAACAEAPTDLPTPTSSDAGAGDAAADAGVASCWPSHAEDAPFEAPDCPGEAAPGERDLLSEALEVAGLDRFAWTDADLGRSSYRGVLGDRFVLPDYAATHGDPANVGCWESGLAASIDHAADGTHPLSRLVAIASARLGRPLDEAEPAEPTFPCESALADAALAFTRAAGGDADAAAVSDDAADVPAEIQPALASILAAMTAVVDARARAVTILGEDAARDVFAYAQGLAGFLGSGSATWIADDDVQRAVTGEAAIEIERAAWELAVAIDHATPVLRAAAVDGAVGFDLDTPAGRVLVRGTGSDSYGADLDPVALLVDLGGDDAYTGAAGATDAFETPVSVVIDVAGRDRYAYDEVPSESDGVGHRLPSDRFGRYGLGRAPYCDEGSDFGPITLSLAHRQGVGILGVGLLVDLGGGDDTYRSLAESQGFGAAGVGILFDDGGDDDYAMESAGQGAGVLGIGILADLTGSDRYVAYTESQGFASVGGAGLFVEGGGDDTYLCDSGIVSEGGDVLYCNPQRPADGNTSMCQGASLGLRGDGLSPPVFLAGGLGVLRDRSGIDSYEASVYAQGTGYWEGIGLLADGGGDDEYEAACYSQGGAPHYAVGMLADAGGNDVYNDREWTSCVAVGSGHDYALGALVDESGDDRYWAIWNGEGTSVCNGVALFVDNAGADVHRNVTTESMGNAHLGDSCVSREGALTGAVFIDAAGDDVYERGGEGPVVDDGVVVSQVGGWDGDHGGTVDADGGDSRIHVR